MGFKVDSSFLRFLTMGALGVRQVAAELKGMGFEPIELERYCASNKIWATKVKRLRLPDLLCVRTGLRAEVRAKSDLKIRMSDAPGNPDRTWDAGLRDEDIVALIACMNGGAGPKPADNAVYFSARSLRESAALSKLGPSKSPSEGAERDRTWPAVVPSRSGRVVSVSADKIVVVMEGDGKPSRKQTYSLKDKHAYVAPEDAFTAETTILAGAPSDLADVRRHLRDTYNPLDHIAANDAMDRYAAVKALRFREDLYQEAVPALEKTLGTEVEVRVALEAAAGAALLGSGMGEKRIADMLWGDASTEMSMEAILILTELKTTFARDLLREAARSDRFSGDERRQAAVWGLGKAGIGSYSDLLPFIADPEENVAYHAIAGFGPETSRAVIDELVAMLLQGDTQVSPAASEALRVIDTSEVLDALVQALQVNPDNSAWVLATIGRLSPAKVRGRLNGTPILDQLEPMLLLAPGANWLADEEAITDLTFLLKQGL